MLVIDPRQLEWRDQLILTRDIGVAGERKEFYAQVRAGEFTPLRRGVFMKTELWSALDPDSQYRARIHAVVAHERTDPVVSHVSAAALWQLPWITTYPRSVHILHDFADGGRSTKAITRHSVGLPQTIEWIDGVRVTSLARTVVDVACAADFIQGVAIADAALRRTAVPLPGVPATTVTREDLLAVLATVPKSHGTARALRTIEFADGSADRPGESISRVNIHLAGLTAPQLQTPLRGASGRLWHVDFWWSQFNLIGEFDGKAKYTDERYLRGRTAAEAVYDEKLREDDLRAAGHGFARWPWAVANSMEKLRALLLAAGLR